MRASAAALKNPAPLPELTIQDLLSYKIAVVANAMSSGAALRFRRDYDVSLGEWRALALIAASSSHSLNGLARAANLDKGQMSRVISSLVARGLVERQTGSRRGLVVRLTLTPRGRIVYRGLIRIAAERNQSFIDCLTPHESAVMQSALTKLFTVARSYVRAVTEEPDLRPASGTHASTR